jgi:uncharacterized membrane protein
MKNLYKAVVALPALLLAGLASAQSSIDVSEVVSSITGDGSTAVAAIGAAILGLIGIVLVFKLVRRAM